jgi:hypothetical protein
MRNKLTTEAINGKVKGFQTQNTNNRDTDLKISGRN